MVYITSFYHFANPRLTPDEALRLQEKLRNYGKEHKLMALILLSSEGINATISGTQQGIQAIKDFVLNELNFKDVAFKDSTSEAHVFVRFKVSIKKEIVTIGSTEIAPTESFNNHVSPREFHDLLKEGALSIDTRNGYEIKIGKFKDAIDLDLKNFGQFPEKIKSLQIPKDKKILIYCTGGIRCEKAIVEMNRQGFNNVLQLSGGILKYLEEVPKEESEWDGECFVFDRRIALDHELQPSRKYTLCPHCGDPASHSRDCLRCDISFKLCDNCVGIPEKQTCSKNCLHHYSVRPGIKGPRQKRTQY